MVGLPGASTMRISRITAKAASASAGYIGFGMMLRPSLIRSCQSKQAVLYSGVIRFPKEKGRPSLVALVCRLRPLPSRTMPCRTWPCPAGPGLTTPSLRCLPHPQTPHAMLEASVCPCQAAPNQARPCQAKIDRAKVSIDTGKHRTRCNPLLTAHVLPRQSLPRHASPQLASHCLAKPYRTRPREAIRFGKRTGCAYRC